MNSNEQIDPLESIAAIRQIMDKSARFLSLSGLSGVWAGIIGVLGAIGGYIMLFSMESVPYEQYEFNIHLERSFTKMNQYDIEGVFTFLTLAGGILIIALAGAIYFTYKKNLRLKKPIWNKSSQKLILALCIPLIVGAFFISSFVLNSLWLYIVPTSLVAYGMGLLYSSKYTLLEIRYLGILQITLGCIALLFPSVYGILFFGLGFGVLHIIYGIVMWKKYDRI